MFGIFSFLINTNIFIAVAAVLFTLETQVQLGMKPHLHPYVFIIFFATLCEYNIHRFLSILNNKNALESEKHSWVKNYLKPFYVLVVLSIIGFAIAVLLAKKTVIIALIPIAIVTLFYSLPLKGKGNVFRLRQISILKIFLIAIVWSASTIVLPIIQTEIKYDYIHVFIMLVERFLFVFAITIPFDIRDVETDRITGLKTIPILVGEKKAILLSNAALIGFMLIAVIHYSVFTMSYLIPAFLISGLSTYYLINNEKAKNNSYYHYGLLDGTMLLQGLLVCSSYYFK
jgi:4-hydroxybenzoate polyprenyltransferase